MVMSQAVKMNVPSTKKLLRAQMKDFPKEKVDLLLPFAGRIKVDKENLDEPENIGEMGQFIMSQMAVKVENPRGTNTQQLIDAANVEVLGLTHYQELL